MQSFPITETTFLLPGAAGNIEVLATPADPDNTKAAVAVICHPHPLYGGTMTNKVVSTLARACQNLGLRTVRFNFRGVGKSEGSFADGVGETEDLFRVIEWAKQACPGAALWLAGFSFGGYIAARAATQLPGVAQLITVAPQASRFTAAPFPPITCPWVLVQGEKDEVVSAEEVFAWVETLNLKPIVIRMPDAGHFFHGKLLELREKLQEVLG